MDSPQKFGLESTENTSQKGHPKKKNTSSIKDLDSKNTRVHDKSRKSLLLPPNSIRNSFINKTGTNVKPQGRQNGKSTTASNVNKQTKGTTLVTDVTKSKAISRKIFAKSEDYENTESDYSTPDPSDKENSLYNKRDNFTMTSPVLGRGKFSSKSTSERNKLVRPSVIMSPSIQKSASKYPNNAELPYSQMENLNISKPSQSLSQNNWSSQKTEYDFSDFNGSNSNNLSQVKCFLEKSIESCENQLLNLKQVLSFVNTMLSKNKPETCIETKENTHAAETLNVSSKFDIYIDDSDTTEIVEKSTEMKNLTFEANALSAESNDAKSKELEKPSPVQDRLPVSIKVLVSDVDLKQEAKEVSNLNDMVRLSTIGEVSCEADEFNKYESENKENQSNSENVTPVTPKTPKVAPRRLSCDSSNRRRSARLAAKRLSISDLDNHDSFTMLEKELNVQRPILSSKSLPASPMKPPMTPGVIKQWDKRVERPLKEYMALKVNGSFLVTPDVKRFQSCLELGPTDTPHSRKSLSRKIFMELCDLYAESPEPK